MAKLGAIFTFGLDGIGKANELHRVNVKWENVIKNINAFTSVCNPHQFEIQFIMLYCNVMYCIVLHRLVLIHL